MKRRGSKSSYSSKISKRGSRRRTLKMAMLFLAPVVAISLFVYIVRLDSLQIKNIEVTGAVVLSRDDIKNALLESISGNYLGVLPKSSLFLVDEKDLEKIVESEFSRVQDANVGKSISGSLKVEVAERTSSGIWCNQSGGCYLLDESGLVFARASLLDMQNKVVFKGVIEGDPILKEFATQKEMQTYFNILDILNEGGLTASSLYIENEDKATIDTSIGDIIFVPKDPKVAEVCENVLLLISSEREKNPEVSFEYIDARFGNKLFYKTK